MFPLHTALHFISCTFCSLYYTRKSLQYMSKNRHWLIPGKCTCKTAEGENANEKASICPDYVPYHDSSAHLVRMRGSYTRESACSTGQ